MRVEIDPMVEDFLMRDEWVERGVLLQHANQHSRLFLQQIQEVTLPQVDALRVQRDGAVPLGDGLYDCLIFSLDRTGYVSKAAWFPCEMVQSRHPDSQDVLFRGHHFLESVLIPLAQAPWLED